MNVRTGTAAGMVAVLLAATAPAASAATPSTTSLSVDGAVTAAVTASYGQPLTVAAQVGVPPAAPDGWVFFVVDGVSRRTDVAPDGTAATVVEGLGTGTHRLSATFVPRDPAQQDGSTSPETTVEVQKVAARPIVRITGKRTDRATRLRVRAVTPYDTEPTGKVRFVVRKRGSVVTRRRSISLEDGTARLTPGSLAAGHYKVVVGYRGDAHHLGFKAVERFRVRRR